jgi:hypothetical protein
VRLGRSIAGRAVGWAVAARLALVAICAQALLPLLLVVAPPGLDHAPRAVALSHIHADLARADGGAPHSGHPPSSAPAGHDHGQCILCLGLQLAAATALTAPSILPMPAVAAAAVAPLPAAPAVVPRAPAAYASRAPPRSA